VKRSAPPLFQGDPVLKKRVTKVGNFVLSSVEETKIPELSVRSKPREEKSLVSSVRSEVGKGESATEVYLRINDKINKGQLMTRHIKGLVRLWCRLCAKPISANKANTASHMSSKTHKDNVIAAAIKMAEEITLSDSLKKWRSGHPDAEGRTLWDITDYFRMETVQTFMLSGVELSKVSCTTLLAFLSLSCLFIFLPSSISYPVAFISYPDR
jgi:hypothetical protein